MHFLNILELSSSVPQVCRAWGLAMRDPVLWKTLDFTILKSNFIKIQREPFVYVHSKSDKTVSRVLKVALGWSNGNPNMSAKVHLSSYATLIKCPRLKRLVFPACHRISQSGLCNALRNWPALESLTVPSIESVAFIMEEIAVHCPKFSKLMVMGTFDILLKTLSLRCSMIFKNALMVILEGLHHLQVLNISHCMIMEPDFQEDDLTRVVGLDKSTVEMAALQTKFITCQERDCVMCERMRHDEGSMKWYRYEEGLWKADEVPSLAL
uniref:F-box/LRR-repeat protein n=1 Tax=Kalanchoe fedtschenkoi TaxID=63787 RepID=A0A7N0ZT03_KALFE